MKSKTLRVKETETVNIKVHKGIKTLIAHQQKILQRKADATCGKGKVKITFTYASKKLGELLR